MILKKQGSTAGAQLTNMRAENEVLGLATWQCLISLTQVVLQKHGDECLNGAVWKEAWKEWKWNIDDSMKEFCSKKSSREMESDVRSQGHVL